MGRKVHPKVFRIGVNTTWNSRWYADSRHFAKYLEQDTKMRKFLMTKLKGASVANIRIERSTDAVTVTIFTPKPGIVIGRGGQGVEDLKKKLKMILMTAGRKTTLKLNIQEVDKPDINAQVVMHNIIEQLEKRLPFRRAMKQAVESVMKAGAEGVKVEIAGRLNGAEIARSEHQSQGRLPLQTLRANMQYARGVARTTYGGIGVKVWVYTGELFENEQEEAAEESSGSSAPRSRGTKR
ncbi:MAG: 30S ribosomal protein S3 [Patescibacteria group bacterium]|jgi:small subunit ribosomal protein S3